MTFPVLISAGTDDDDLSVCFNTFQNGLLLGAVFVVVSLVVVVDDDDDDDRVIVLLSLLDPPPLPKAPNMGSCFGDNKEASLGGVLSFFGSTTGCVPLLLPVEVPKVGNNCCCHGGDCGNVVDDDTFFSFLRLILVRLSPPPPPPKNGIVLRGGGLLLLLSFLDANGNGDFWFELALSWGGGDWPLLLLLPSLSTTPGH